jgi:hypothetical protein
MLLIGRGGAPKAPGPFACRIRRRAIFLEAPVVGGNRQPPGQESGLAIREFEGRGLDCAHRRPLIRTDTEDL